MRRLLVTASTTLLAACASAPARTEAPTVVVAATAPVARPIEVTQEEASSVAQSLRKAQLDYLENRGTTALFAMHAPDLEARAARSKAPGERESVFNGDHLRGIYAWSARHGVPTKATMGETTIERGVDSINVEWSFRLDHPGRQDAAPSAFGEHYVLERRAGEWKIVRLRYWPLRPDTMEEFGADYFADLDRQIEKIESLGDGSDDRNRAWLLLAAYRFEECAALSRTLTERTPLEPWVWEMRANASAMVGDGEDAEAATRTAEHLARP